MADPFDAVAMPISHAGQTPGGAADALDTRPPCRADAAQFAV
jgi:hypothetical protein